MQPRAMCKRDEVNTHTGIAKRPPARIFNSVSKQAEQP